MNNDGVTKRAYAAKHRSRLVVENSSSGGAFTAFSDWVLQQNGIIIGAVFDQLTQNVHHAIACTKEERDMMRGSKYIWSDLNDVYGKSVSGVKNNIWTMFVGTPCQVEGYKGYLKHQKLSLEHVILCDIVCHGTPEPRIWKEYVHYFNKKYGKIDKLNFRDKRKGWAHPSAYAYCKGKEISIADYNDIFYSQCALQNKCYSCKFASLNRPGDITIGDCWGIERVNPDFCDDKGVSLVISHNEKGSDFINNAKGELILKEIPLESCLQPNLIAPTRPSPERKQFLREYEKYGIRFVLAKYSKHRLFGKIRYKIKYILSR